MLLHSRQSKLNFHSAVLPAKWLLIFYNSNQWKHWLTYSLLKCSFSLYCNAPGLVYFLWAAIGKFSVLGRSGEFIMCLWAALRQTAKAVILSTFLQGYLLKCASDLKFLFLFQYCFSVTLPGKKEKNKSSSNSLPRMAFRKCMPQNTDQIFLIFKAF